MWFLLGGGWGFYNVFGDRPTKWPIEKTKSKHAPRQIINKDLQEGMVIKGIYMHLHTQNVYTRLCNCKCEKTLYTTTM